MTDGAGQSFPGHTRCRVAIDTGALGKVLMITLVYVARIPEGSATGSANRSANLARRAASTSGSLANDSSRKPARSCAGSPRRRVLTMPQTASFDGRTGSPAAGSLAAAAAGALARLAAGTSA